MAWAVKSSIDFRRAGETWELEQMKICRGVDPLSAATHSLNLPMAKRRMAMRSAERNLRGKEKW